MIKSKNDGAKRKWMGSGLFFGSIDAPENALMDAAMQKIGLQRRSLIRYVRAVALFLPLLLAVFLVTTRLTIWGNGLVLGVLLFVTALLGFGADLFYLSNALRTIDIRPRAVAPDALPMFSPQAEVVAARNGLAQMRNWRLTAVEMGLRFTLAVIFVLQTDFTTISGSYFLVVMLFTLALITFILEPLWRMRTIAAIGVAALPQRKHIVRRSLISIAVIVVVRALQIGLLFGVVVVVSQMIARSFPFYEANNYSDSGYLPLALSEAFGVLVGSLLIWANFRFWRVQAVRFANRGLLRVTNGM